jgi:hypothetical protein
MFHSLHSGFSGRKTELVEVGTEDDGELLRRDECVIFL